MISSTRPPVTPTNPELNRILQDIQTGADDANDAADEPSAKKGKYIKLTFEHFERLMNTCTGQQALIARLIDSPDTTALQTSTHSSS